MAGRELQEYRSFVAGRLARMTEMLAKISMGDFSDRVDIGILPEDEFLNAFVGLDMLMDDLLEARKELEQEAKRASLRAEIWRVSGGMHNEDDLALRLLSLAGESCEVDRASFFQVEMATGDAVCGLQWQKPGLTASVGLRIPASLVQRFMDEEYVVIGPETFPPEFAAELRRIFTTYGIVSFLAIPVRDVNQLQGFYTFSHSDPDRIWSTEEIGILQEMAKISSLRSAYRKADESLRAANQRLEDQVRARTAELRAANEQLRRDIDERRRAEAALAESERFLNNVFASIQDGISVLDKDFKIVRVNPTMERLYPHAVPLVGKKCFDAYHGCEGPCEICPTRQTLETSRAAYEMVPLRGARSEIIGWLELYSFPLFDTATGQLRGVIEYVRDVSERRKAEKALAEEMEFLNVTLQSIAEGVVSADMTGAVVLMNPVAEHLTGWPLGQAVGAPIGDVVRLVDPETHEPVSAPFDLVKESGAPVAVPMARLIVARDGTERPASYSAAPIRGNDGSVEGVVFVIRDVTERERMEQEIFKAAKLESLGLLAGGIAHDFNNILTGIVTNLFMAKMNLGGNDETRQLIIDAEKAAFRASRLTKQLLTFSKGGSPVKEAVSLRSVIEDAVGFCLSGSKVNYRLEIPDDLWSVQVDRGQIDQVINNLVINADQAMPNGGTIVVKAENYVISDRIATGTAAALPLKPGNYARVSVVDEGIGIPAHDLLRIFDPYFTTKQEGSGLGLTTAFSIIKKHGGHLTARSRLGGGSTFSFFLPASAVDARSEGATEEKLRPGSFRVLVMDDDEVVRMVVERLLKTHGYEVLCVNNGTDAIEQYRLALAGDRRFDMVIMDLTVPGGVGGKEAVNKILEVDPGARVIVFSGYSNDPVMSDYRAYGFSGVLAKPFSIDEFSREVNRIMHPSGPGPDGPAPES